MKDDGFIERVGPVKKGYRQIKESFHDLWRNVPKPTEGFGTFLSSHSPVENWLLGGLFLRTRNPSPGDYFRPQIIGNRASLGAAGESLPGFLHRREPCLRSHFYQRFKERYGAGFEPEIAVGFIGCSFSRVEVFAAVVPGKIL